MKINPKPTVPEVLPLAAAYLGHHPVGGNLQLVLSDRNFANKHVLFCAEQAAEVGDAPGLRLARLLLRMSVTQRRKLNTLLTGATFVS